MKLVHMEYPFYIEFEENKANILSIENTNVFTKVLKSFMEQTEGKESRFDTFSFGGGYKPKEDYKQNIICS